MSARSIAAAELEVTLSAVKVKGKPKFRVVPNPLNKLDPIQPGYAVLVIVRDSFKPGPGTSNRTHSLSLWVCVPGLDLNLVEDALDDAAAEISDALYNTPHLLWSGDAERSIYQDTNHAYRFPVQTITTDKE